MRKRNQFTKLAYQEYLDQFCPSFHSEEWIIGGVFRTYFRNKGRYGQAIRSHDPIRFEVGYNEWKLNKK